MLSIDYGVIDECRNPEESYGEICVQCNRCGRFSRDEDRMDPLVEELWREEDESRMADMKVGGLEG